MFASTLSCVEVTLLSVGTDDFAMSLIRLMIMARASGDNFIGQVVRTYLYLKKPQTLSEADRLADGAFMAALHACC